MRQEIIADAYIFVDSTISKQPFVKLTLDLCLKLEVLVELRIRPG